MVDAAADASTLAEQGKFAEAVSLYLVAVNKQPDRASLHEQLSQCLLETEQYAEAYAAAVQACSLEPNWPDAALTLARCSLNCGLLVQAHVQYVHYLGMEPSNQEAAEELAELKHLQHQQLTAKIGISGLQIEELHGAENGPGHVVWEAGIVLSHYLVNHRELVYGKRVLELGCGTGIVGITAACLGARAVLTDTEAVVQHAQQNVDHNVLCINNGQGSAECAPLDWENSYNSSVLLNPYDVVIGADLIYAAKYITALVETLGNLRRHSRDVRVVLGHKERNPEILQKLMAQLESTGITTSIPQESAACAFITRDQTLSSSRRLAAQNRHRTHRATQQPYSAQRGSFAASV